jgi:hypothetical protein
VVILEKAKKPIYKKWWFWVIVVIVIGAIANGGDDEGATTANAPESKPAVQAESKPTAAPTEAPKPTEKPAEKPPELSKDGVSSDVKIVVDGIESAAKIGDNMFMIAEAQGIFQIIKVTLTNGQKDAITIDANSFKLVDDQKREFSYSSDAQMAFSASNTKKESFLLTKVNPGLSVTGYIAFDVPKDAKGFVLEARGGMTGKKIQLKVE